MVATTPSSCRVRFQEIVEHAINKLGSSRQAALIVICVSYGLSIISIGLTAKWVHDVYALPVVTTTNSTAYACPLTPETACCSNLNTYEASSKYEHESLVAHDAWLVGCGAGDTCSDSPMTCCPHFWNGEAGEGAGNDIADDPVGVLACIAIGFVIANVLLFQWKIYYYSRKDLRLGLCAFATTFFSKVILLFALAAFTETGYIARGLVHHTKRDCYANAALQDAYGDRVDLANYAIVIVIFEVAICPLDAFLDSLISSIRFAEDESASNHHVSSSV